MKLYVHFDPRSGYRVSDAKLGAAVFTLQNAQRFVQAAPPGHYSMELIEDSNGVLHRGEAHFNTAEMDTATTTFDG